MYNGKIIKSSRKTVEGTFQQSGWSDEWVESFDIEFDGDITNDVARAIVEAFRASPLHNAQSQSSYGALRWMCADGAITVNRFNRTVEVQRRMGIAD